MTPWPLLSSSPFDTESFLVSPSPTGKFSVGSRKGFLYNWTPPSTPSFRERYYLVSEPRRAGVPWSSWDREWGDSPGASTGAGLSSTLRAQPPCLGVILGVFLYFCFLAADPSILGPLHLVLGSAGSSGCLGWGSLDGSTTPAMTLASSLFYPLVYVSSR